MEKVLIIDDEEKLRGLLARIISLEGYEVFQAWSCSDGLQVLVDHMPEAVLCDVKLPDGNGVEMVTKIKAAAPDTEVILLTAYGNIPDGVQAMRNGAFDYITKENFIAVNCAAFTKELLESELFGYKAGAFTGAMKDKKGLLDEAHRGTLFLDEIGEMSIDLQAKLLRVLENGEFIRVGETMATKTDIRIIAATNRDLQKEIREGRFREDLFYRLSVFTIHLPSLSERTEDIMGRKITCIEPGYMQAMQSHVWHGNVRELRNVV